MCRTPQYECFLCRTQVLLVFPILAAVVLSGCKYDDDLWNAVDDNTKRIEELEKKVEQMNGGTLTLNAQVYPTTAGIVIPAGKTVQGVSGTVIELQELAADQTVGGTVRNCVITGFRNGVYANNAPDVNITGNTITANRPVLFLSRPIRE